MPKVYVTQEVPQGHHHTANWVFRFQIGMNEGIEIQTQRIALQGDVSGVLLDMFVGSQEGSNVVGNAHTLTTPPTCKKLAAASLTE